MELERLDHVALWVADRDAIADFSVAHLGMHVIERTDRFTLIGSNARRGKFTLFAEEPNREAGALAEIGLRVTSLEQALAALPAGHGERFEICDGLWVRLVEEETDVDYDLHHVALTTRDPAAAADVWEAIGMKRAGEGRMEVAGAYRGALAGRPGHSRAPAAQPSRRAREVRRGLAGPRGSGGRRSSRRRRCAEHVRRVRVGPRAREARVRRAQARLLARVTVVVAGAGMAGLVAAARLGELGRHVTVREKGTRPGGSMLLSSGVIWRHRTFEDFRAECPAGYPELQQLILDQLDDRLDWLESLGAQVVLRETGNPHTVGRRFNPRDLVPALLRHAGDVLLGEPVGDVTDEPLVLATGGFGAALARRVSLPLRANPWSEGDALALARGRGATTSAGMDEFYGRALPVTPAELPEETWVRLGQVYGRHALVLDETGAAVDSVQPRVARERPRPGDRAAARRARVVPRR